MPVSRVECTKVRSLRGQKSVQLHTITVALGQVVLWAPKSVPIGLAMATAQNSCLGWPSRHILSAGSSLKPCCKIEVIVPFIIDFLEGLYILHTVPVIDNVDSDDLWTGDVNPTLRKWRIWLVWEQKNLDMSKSMTNLSIHLVYHSSRDDLVLWDKSMFCKALPKFIILSRDAQGSISLLRGGARSKILGARPSNGQRELHGQHLCHTYDNLDNTW